MAYRLFPMNLFRLPLKRLSLFLLVSFLAGCSSGPDLGGLGVSLVTIKPLGSTLLESRFALTLRFVNENVVPVGISGSKHKLYLDETYVGQAVSDQAVGLASLTSATHDVTLLVDNAAVAGRLRGILERGRANYRLESTLFVTAGEENLKTQTSRRGSIDLRGLSAVPSPLLSPDEPNPVDHSGH